MGVKSFPVRYMVIKSWFGYKVIDTLDYHKWLDCFNYSKVVCKSKAYYDAQRICKAINNAEGYTYAF